MFKHPILESPELLEPLNVSKWLKVSFLIDVNEMERLFHYLKEMGSELWFYHVQGVVSKTEAISSDKEFLERYASYIAVLKNSEIPPIKELQSFFSCAFSASNEAVYALVLKNDRYLIKARKPIIQVQKNLIRYSTEDDSFRTGVYGEGSFSWGLTISYPQIYQDPKTYEILSVQEFPNTGLFKAIQKWLRDNTRATPFVVNGKKTNEPIRLGKECFKWIHKHAGLKELKISIEGAFEN